MDHARHTCLWHNRETYEPVPFLHDGILEWCKRRSLAVPDLAALRETPADLDRGSQIAMAWEHCTDMSHLPLVREAYDDLKLQTERMWDFATNDLGVACATTVAPGTEPYPDGKSQARDIVTNGRIITETGLGGDHPCMSQDDYDQFRAVHDLFGHAAIGTGFDRHGEYQAFLAHCAMYTGLARWAMASEYRGVNSSLWAGRAAGAGKAVLLPPWLVFDR